MKKSTWKALPKNQWATVRGGAGSRDGDRFYYENDEYLDEIGNP